MQAKWVESISQEIYRRFPEFKGVKPKVQKRVIPSSRGITKASNYLLIFSNKVTTATKRMLPRLLRVVVDEHGKIKKITTSH